MKVHRFVGATAREALGLVREALGPEAMILANRNVDAGVEILACTELDYSGVLAVFEPDGSSGVAPAPAVAAPGMDAIMDEIRAMRDALATQMNQLAWAGEQQRKPAKAALLQKLTTLGFSTGLARQLAEKAPLDGDVEEALEWAKDVLVRNVDVLPDEERLLDGGGVFALIGPTGVGKTTTTAKLAARYVMRHGPGKLALITTDGYRIGAHEQLRIYGKILGVMVHSVKDEVDLRIALDELSNKHTVLIDTVGMSQRDQMVAEQVAMLSGTKVAVKRLLCLNATSTIETLNEVVRAYRGSGLEGCILTKLDEAATISNALDVVLRHRLCLYYLGIGQRVPEDLEVAQASSLVEQAFEQALAADYAPQEDKDWKPLLGIDGMRGANDTQGSHVA